MADKYNFEAERAQDIIPKGSTQDYDEPNRRAIINPGLRDLVSVPNKEPVYPSRVLFCNLMDSKVDNSMMLGTHSLSQARAAFSTVNLRGINPIMRLRRNLDSTEADLYMLSDDYYVNGTTKLWDWIAGSTSIFIPSWYDQSGSGRNAVQSVEASMPLLKVTNKVLSVDTRTNRFFNLPDGTLPSGNRAYTLSARHGVVDSTNGFFVSSGTVGTSRASLGLKRDAINGYVGVWWAADFTISTFANSQSVAETYDGFTRVGYINGTSISSTTSGVRNSTIINNRIGVRSDLAEYLNGDLFELHVFGNALDASSMSSLHYGYADDAQAIYGALRLSPWYSGPIANVRRSSDNVTSDVYVDIFGNYWSNAAMTTTLSSFAGSDTLFIPTLYDQSGSARNATQITLASQPKLDFVNRLLDFKPSAWMSMPDATVPIGNNPYTLYVRHGTINSISGGFMMAGNISVNNQVISFRRSIAAGEGYDLHWRGNPGDLNFGAYAPNQSVAQTYDQAVRRSYVNGSLLLTVASTGKNTQAISNRLAWSTNSVSDVLNGELQSVFILGRVLSDGDIMTLDWYASKFVPASIPGTTIFTTTNSPEILGLKPGTTARLTRGNDVTIQGLNNMFLLKELDVADDTYMLPSTVEVTNHQFEELTVTTTSTEHNALLLVEPGVSI